MKVLEIIPTGIDIQKIRTNLQMTQIEFAELIGVDRRTIINYEQGKKIPATKVKLLQLMLENGAMKSIPDKNQRMALKAIRPIENEVDILKGDIVDLKDHIKTLKEFIEEKNKLADIYRSDNLLLK
ncbi:MAG: DNA-binding XRE family transcriptional regulator, partial [Vicingaceae bacterium]